jgi:7,8-dihydro-6-hydroxymethylpterin dimethyltransferase
MMTPHQLLNETESLCPVCLEKIPARIVAHEDCVYLAKTCRVHGDFQTVIWRESAEHYRQWADAAGFHPGVDEAASSNCPSGCGLCSQHCQGTASAAIMTTSRCNLRCPFCFTNAGEEPYDPGLEEIRRMFVHLWTASGNCPVELCGGEPTLRDDLPRILEIGREIGFDHFQINTNGLRIAEEDAYLRRIKQGGAAVIYLQFDGVDDDVYRRLRGRALLDEKVRAVRRCAEEKIGVVLVPTLVQGMNLNQVGEIIRFAKEQGPSVRGVFFQPASYFGRHPGPPGDDERLTIPDVLKAIEEQTDGELPRSCFVPPTCEHPHCSFASASLRVAGRLAPTTRFQPSQPGANPLQHAQQYTKRFWRYPEDSDRAGEPASTFNAALQRLCRDSFFVSGMAFQDVWNIDLERLRHCCLHIVSGEDRLIPLCAKYVTSADGTRLYPGMG